MSDNRPKFTLLLTALLLAAITLYCAVDMPAASLFSRPAQVEAADVASDASARFAPHTADQLLADALRRVLSYSSIVTRVEYSTATPAATGAGYYLEKGALLRRLELQLHGIEDSRLLQISNGRILWTRCTTPRETTTNEAKTPTPLRSPQMRLAELGLPGLLAQLQQDYDLTLVGGGKLGNEQVYVLKAILKRETLKRLLPHSAAEIDSGAFSGWSELPPKMPRALLVALGSDDAVPRRIQFHTIADGVELLQWPKLEMSETLTIDFRDVQLNQPIASSTFTHS
ncbi:MAG: hypothetical protein ACIALR_05075 [Blastopirellula sp. JB062]